MSGNKALQYLLLTALVACFTSGLLAQTRVVDPISDPPIFKVISPDINSGKITLRWDRSPSPDSLIKGYIIYRLEKDNLGQISTIKIDSVDASTFIYTDISATVNSNAKQVSYRLATKGKLIPSRLTDPHKTMWATAKYDSCKATLKISWTRYVGWGNRVKRYHIYSSIGNQTFDSGALVKIGTVTGTDTIYSLPNITENEHYHFAILAVKDDADSTSSWSNHIYKNTLMPIAPATMGFDSLVSSQNAVRLRYRIDNQTGTDNFEIFRSDNIFSIFNSIHPFTDKTETEFADNGLVRGRTYFYYIIAKNKCNNIVARSDTAQSLIVNVQNAGETNNLVWQEYPLFGGSVTYSVWRKTSIDPSFMQIATNITEATYTDDVSSLFGKNVSPEVCYRIEAEWIKGNYKTVSQSQVSCISIVPDIVMPNAIDPLSEMVNPGTNKRRNRFEPITGFVVDFSLQVFDRNGRVLYDGSTGWDGRINQGEFVKPGSYIYVLKVTLPSGKVLEKSGTVNVLYTKM
ncbi:hypothetical protein [Williamwhitmania taraxaci]|uniref:Gliding motility-associated C-terminal domain-containing protein n=1 Tax=Williamwhitmania taraxaci TaxID=1640674 RepID=A0A1G6K408_9BACT|nr:hypothetical protein [Williamwhitmania taraxaci]SDC25673.1 hypothetical protein SAMN05216323_10233 [Williamwhitmania taraxaci]